MTKNAGGMEQRKIKGDIKYGLLSSPVSLATLNYKIGPPNFSGKRIGTTTSFLFLKETMRKWGGELLRNLSYGWSGEKKLAQI